MNTEMKQFLCKLIPPRPTFAQDMAEVERKIMQEHVVYWKALSDRRIAIIFGPDPKGTWGLPERERRKLVDQSDELCQNRIKSVRDNEMSTSTSK